MAKVYVVTFRSHDDRRPSKFIVLADSIKSAMSGHDLAFMIFAALLGGLSTLFGAVLVEVLRLRFFNKRRWNETMERFRRIGLKKMIHEILFSTDDYYSQDKKPQQRAMAR